MILTANEQYKRITNLNEAEQKAPNYQKKLRICDYKIRSQVRICV